MIHHIKRATRHLIFWSLIAAALGLTGVRLLLTGIDNYKSDIATYLGELMGAPVKIGHLRAKMRGFSPELVLTEIDVASMVAKENPAIRFKEIRLGLNLLDTLISRDPLSSSWVTLVGAKLSVKRKADGRIAVEGLKTSDEQPLWLLQGKQYEVLQSQVLWQDEKNKGLPLQFAMVDAAIINDDQRHRINILMKLPKQYGDAIRISMDVEGNVFEPSTIQGVVFAEGKKLKPAELIPELPFNLKISSGTSSFKIWSGWQHSQLVSVNGMVQFQPLNLLRQDKEALFINKLDTRFNWELDDKLAGSGSPWRFDVSHFSLETATHGKSPNNKSLTGAFVMTGQRNNGNFLPKIGLFVEQLDLPVASALALFFAPLQAEQSQILKQAQLKGQLDDFSLYADWAEKTAAINAKFARLGVASVFAAPGIENLTGHIKGTDKHGVIRFSTENAQVNSGSLFREALSIKKLQGMVAWSQSQENWVLSSANIELNSPDIQTKSRMELIIPKNESQTFLDLQTAFTGNDASKARHYLPTGILKKTVVDWLDRAFISGRVPKGAMLFRGKPSDFPFKNGEGVFETLFDADKFELAYHPEWPHLTGVKAEVLFFQDGLEVNLQAGQSKGLTIKQAEVSIPVLGGSEHLLVQGELAGSIGDALSFMQQTPLKDRINPVLDAITPQGDTQVALNLKVPLIDSASARVDVTAQLNNAKLGIKSPALWVTQLHGQLKFNEQGVYSDVIHGTALGHPIQITVKNSARETMVNVNGRSTVGALQDQFKLPLQDVAKGTASYQLQLHLPTFENTEDTDKTPILAVQSMLDGVSLDLPGLLTKTKEQKTPLSLTFGLVDQSLALPITLNYDNRVKAAVKLDVKEQRLQSGHILIGNGEALQRQEPGIKFEINQDQMALQDWLSLAVQNRNAEAVADIREIKIHGTHALWHKTDLGSFNLMLKPDNKKWGGTIGSIFANGKISFPMQSNDTSKIVLDMEMLDISALKQLNQQTKDEAQTVSPKTVPLFTLSSKKTLWDSIDLGYLTVETQRLPAGIAFKQIELTGPDEKLTLSGDWTMHGKQSATHTKGHLELAKAGSLLARLGATHDLAETVATVDFTVDWNAAPYQLALPALKGQFEAKLKNGRILSIEPGFGRVLGVLAMAQWIKRLQLDFRDVYEEGLTFNTIKGRFDLRDGKVVTNNLVVDAVPAKITITGSTDLVARTVDHIVNVAPKSADAVPIAGTIMGKIALLVARSLTGENHEGFLFGSQYLVKGEWGNAQIIPMHENDGLLQKTWNGITAFPWLEQP